MGAEGDERLVGDRATSIGERDKHRTTVGREVVRRYWCLRSGQADTSTPPGDYHLICLTKPHSKLYLPDTSNCQVWTVR